MEIKKLVETNYIEAIENQFLIKLHKTCFIHIYWVYLIEKDFIIITSLIPYYYEKTFKHYYYFNTINIFNY
jgi:hypothetical protein